MAPVRRSSAAAGDACAEPIVTRTGQPLGRCGSALDRLQFRDIRTWLNQLRTTCQCCAQGKDATRPADRRRCCAIGACCHQVLSERTIKDVRDVLRAALANAVAEELLPRNVAAIVRLPTPRKPQRQWWSVEEARAFLGSARRDQDPLYAAYVLILVLGLRRSEALGLTWPDVSFDEAEVHIQWQLQRAGHRLRHRETKTTSSTAVLPLPDICVTALKLLLSTGTPIGAGLPMSGMTQSWCSPVPTALPTSRGTSTGNSPPGAGRQISAISRSTTPGAHAPPSALSAAMVFSASLGHLLATPRLYG